MKEQIKSLYDHMQENLRNYEVTDLTPVKKLSAKLDIIARATDQLRLYLETNEFENDQEEISFFKNVKPLFVCEQFFAQHIFNIETKKKELKEESAIRNYFEQELGFTRHYFNQHQFLYQYFQLEATELDSILFKRGSESSLVILPETPDLDPKFSTKGDYLFAKFIAYKRVFEYLTSVLFPATEREELKRTLKWTGDKINLIEIAYAIHDTAQINNGDIDIKEIISWLEDTLNISLNRYYKMFGEMKDRKIVSPTRYLDHAASMIQEHLRHGDAFRPQVPQAVSGSKSSTKK